MKDFIEVTDHFDEEKKLINLNMVVIVEDNVLCYTQYGSLLSGDPQWIHCEESYEQIKNLISKAKNEANSNNGANLLVTPRVRYKTNFHKSQYEIFDVRTDKNGYPQFLIYDKGQWFWKSAKYFEPFK